MFLKGNVGTLKTSLAVAIAYKYISELGNDVKFLTMSSLVAAIFSNKISSNDQFENDLKTVSLLILDDLGAENPERWILSKIDAIISERYNRQLPTIFTTNLTNAEILKIYSQRICDRIRSSTVTINFSGDSLRTNNLLKK